MAKRWIVLVYCFQGKWFCRTIRVLQPQVFLFKQDAAEAGDKVMKRLSKLGYKSECYLIEVP